MVGIKRESIPEELERTNREFQKAISGMSREQAYNFYQREKSHFQYNTQETKQAFKKMNYERCSFCTKYISDFDDEMTIEHIDIKRDFPEKIFQWTNLLCACHTCNTKRSTNACDESKYLDPTKVMDIEKYFSYDLDGSISQDENLDWEDQQKADYMINLYKLKRKGLVCKRREFMKDLMEDEAYFEGLKEKGRASQRIIFLSVFTYYKRYRGYCEE